MADSLRLQFLLFDFICVNIFLFSSKLFMPLHRAIMTVFGMYLCVASDKQKPDNKTIYNLHDIDLASLSDNLMGAHENSANS
ncbi:MAG: hypothetical protein CFE49_00375 [Pseudomonas sp. PGPPP3]|nr:MAG: hypothetical protein CFE49_00375 [Pseudomonas sp. PGPPP3]